MAGSGELGSNVAFALRLMRKRPAFSALVVATLALGIGANTAMFTLADAVLLRPLPYRAPESLHMLWLSAPPLGGREAIDQMPWSYPKFLTLRTHARGFSGIAAFSDVDVTMGGDAAPERISAELVTGDYFDVLGIPALHGRTFEHSYPRGAAPFVVLSHALWTERFGGDPALAGRTVVLNGVTMDVLGVAPASFRGVTGQAELWIPVEMAGTFGYRGVLEEDGNHWLRAVGRTADGVGADAVPGLLAAAGRAVVETHGPAEWTTRAIPFREAREDPVLRRAVLVLLGAVAAVLLIACVNVANLLLVRATQREREVAVRRALGASTERLVGQLLTESLVLACFGMALGLVLALWGVDLLTHLTPERTAALGMVAGEMQLERLSLNGRVLAFTTFITLATGLLFGAIPAFQLGRSDATVLREAAHGRGPRRLPRWLHGARGVLVVSEIALALVLLTGASLMLRSFAKLRAVELGFEPRQVLTFTIEPTAGAYTLEESRLLQERILDRIAALPGVEAVGADRCPPLQSCMTSVVTRAGTRQWDLDAGQAGPGVGVHTATPGYFETLRVPVLRGRVFDGTERPGTPLVVVISERTAARLFPGEDPIGQRLTVASAYWGGGVESAEVTGVVGNVRYAAPDVAGDDLHVYTPAWQFALRATTFMVRTAGEPEEVLEAVRTVVLAEAPDLPVFNVRSMQERVADATARTRFATLLLGIFASAALALAAIGIYGVMSFMVAQRTRELGVRMALGAARSNLLGLVLRQGALLVLLGSVLGLVGAWSATRALQGLLFQLEPDDPLTLAAGVAVLVVVAMGAVLVPAWRATHNDPVEALRSP